MNKIKYISNKILWLFALATLLLVYSCNKNKEEKKEAAKEESSEYYTCSMHTFVHSKVPGKCPVCGMTLIKVGVNSGQSQNGNKTTGFRLTENQKILGDIKIDTAQIKTIGNEISLLGIAVPDENNITVISSRINGRIDKLFMRNPGEKIAKGQMLFAIYSEELLADEKDFLNTVEQQSKFSSQQKIVDELAEASKMKLKLWGWSDQQITELASSKEISPSFSYTSKESGFLLELKINEGDYVEEGTPLFKIANLNTIWIEAQVYPDQIKYLNQQSEVYVSFEGAEKKSYKGKVVFENPSLDEDKKFSKVRIEIQNLGNKITPGMMAYVYLKTQEKKTLVIPKSALLLLKMKTVWVQLPDGSYESRNVETGMQNKNEVEIISGIKEDELVISSGAFLLQSEYTIRNGANAMGGMKM
ncbi:MAG: efflux RND transporter periplasmic adaptor subunit [Bacteroidota bacterium]